MPRVVVYLWKDNLVIEDEEAAIGSNDEVLLDISDEEYTTWKSAKKDWDKTVDNVYNKLKEMGIDLQPKFYDL